MTDREQGIKWLSEAIAEIARLYEARSIPSGSNRSMIEQQVRRAVAVLFPEGSPERGAYGEFKLGSVGVAFSRDVRVAMRQVLGTAKNDLDGLLQKAQALPADGSVGIAVAVPERSKMTHPVGTAGFQATVFRVLIASPGDTTDGRQTVRQSIHDWNDVHTVRREIVLLPVMWETHSTPKLGGRPQGILNTQFVDDVDLAIAVFRARLGQATGVSDSGTIEEIERCLSAGKHVGVYFSNEAVPLGQIDAQQLQKLNAFKQRVKHEGIFGEYATQADLHRVITAGLTRLVDGLSGASAHPRSNGDVLAAELDVPSVAEITTPPPSARTRVHRDLAEAINPFARDWEAQSDPPNRTVMADLAEELGRRLRNIRDRKPDVLSENEMVMLTQGITTCFDVRRIVDEPEFLGQCRQNVAGMLLTLRTLAISDQE